MALLELKDRENTSGDDKLSRLYSQLQELLNELRKKELSPASIALINGSVEELNASTLAANEFVKLVKQKQSAILKQAEKEDKVVPKNYYRNMWMLLGFSAFGLPIGVAFGLSMGNMGLLGTGLPFGMAIGFAVGAAMDKKAVKEGRQLNIEIKY